MEDSAGTNRNLTACDNCSAFQPAMGTRRKGKNGARERKHGRAKVRRVFAVHRAEGKKVLYGMVCCAKEC